MLLIKQSDLADAVEQMIIATRKMTDERGLIVRADTPRSNVPMMVGDMPLPDYDWKRIQAIVLGALVALANSPVRVTEDEPVSLRGS